MEHFCNIHRVPFKKFEKDGSSWYSHKTDDPAFPKGYCNEPKEASSAPKPTAPAQTSDFKSESMFMCNALNNAVALVNAAKVDVGQLEATYKKLLNILRNEPEF